MLSSGQYLEAAVRFPQHQIAHFSLLAGSNTSRDHAGLFEVSRKIIIAIVIEICLEKEKKV